MKKFLVCHTEDGDFYTKGESYLVVKEDERVFHVKDNYDDYCTFTKEEDSNGLSYKSWFTIEESEGLNLNEDIEQTVYEMEEVVRNFDYTTIHMIKENLEEIIKRMKHWQV